MSFDSTKLLVVRVVCDIVVVAGVVGGTVVAFVVAAHGVDAFAHSLCSLVDIVVDAVVDVGVW